MTTIHRSKDGSDKKTGLSIDEPVKTRSKAIKIAKGSWFKRLRIWIGFLVRLALLKFGKQWDCNTLRVNSMSLSHNYQTFLSVPPTDGHSYTIIFNCTIVGASHWALEGDVDVLFNGCTFDDCAPINHPNLFMLNCEVDNEQ